MTNSGYSRVRSIRTHVFNNQVIDEYEHQDDNYEEPISNSEKCRLLKERLLKEKALKEKLKKDKSDKDKPDKECDDDCFCEDDLQKSRLNELEEKAISNKKEFRRRQLRSSIIMAEVLSEPVCKKRHKR